MKPDINAWWGRAFKLAILAAAAIHAVALLTLSIPVSRTYVGPTYEGDGFPILSIVSQPRRTAPEPAGQQLDDAPHCGRARCNPRLRSLNPRCRLRHR